jgi:hypothetical protein
MPMLCVIDPQGRHLPEPTADNERDLIEAFECLSETCWETFKADGYTIGTLPTVN